MNQENPPTTKKEPLRCESGCEIQKNPEEIGTMARLTQALPPGKHPGFSNLPSKSGVYRCKLHFQANKLDPGHADFKGVLQLSGSKASQPTGECLSIFLR